MSRRLECPHCKSLLAIQAGDQIEIQYKTAKYVVKAPESVLAYCRKCGREVELIQ